MPSALRSASLLGARSGSKFRLRDQLTPAMSRSLLSATTRATPVVHGAGSDTRTIHHHPILPMDPAAPIRPSLLLRPYPKQKGRSTRFTLLSAISPLKTLASRTLTVVALRAPIDASLRAAYCGGAACPAAFRVRMPRRSQGPHAPTLSGSACPAAFRVCMPRRFPATWIRITPRPLLHRS